MPGSRIPWNTPMDKPDPLRTNRTQYLDHRAVHILTMHLAAKIDQLIEDDAKPRVYGVPRGGIPVGYMLGTMMDIRLVESPEEADFIVDDLIDSGRTRDEYDIYGVPFLALIDKTLDPEWTGQWVVFPWENARDDQSATDVVVRLLQYIGEDPDRGGLIETPKRVLKAWDHWTSGYGRSPAEVLKTFEDGAERVNELVLVKSIPFYSHCEHHLAPFFGTAHIGYIPDGKIVGLSKLSRLLDIYARRLQVQERLTNQVADAIDEHLNPLGVGVVVEARHLCMESRGICQQGHSTVTSAMRGALLDKPEARAEFLSLVG